MFITFFIAVLYAPAVPLTEGMVGPVPVPFFEYFYAVAQVVVGAFARCPADGAELSYIDTGIVIVLPIFDGLEVLAEGFFVPLFSTYGAGVGNAGRGGANA